MARPDVDEYFMSMAELVATRATCPRIAVGCVLIDEHRHVIATGYNGVPIGHLHCSEHPCEQADKPLGLPGSLCLSIHAEQNALLQCRDQFSVSVAYVTHTPCLTCVKLLLNTSATQIVFRHHYPPLFDKPGKFAFGAFEDARLSIEKLWITGGRSWRKL